MTRAEAVAAVTFAIVAIALIAAVCAWSIFGGAATCARACGAGRMSKWSPGAQGVVEQCVCEVTP